MTNILWLRTICRKNNVLLTDVQANSLESFVSLLLQQNHRLNLISRKDEENIWQYHILHSLSVLFKFEFPQNCKILDLGTGGGLPGIPLRILLPSAEFTLIDSIQKKVNAVDEIIRSLQLPNIQVICSRAEDLAKKLEFKHRFDIVVCRAIGPLKKIITWSAPLLKPGGQPIRSSKTQISTGTLVALKGGNLDKEIQEAQKLGNVKSIEEVPLVFTGSELLPQVDKKIVLVKF